MSNEKQHYSNILMHVDLCNKDSTLSVNLSINKLTVMSTGGLGTLMDIIICFSRVAALFSLCNDSCIYNYSVTIL